MSYKYPAPLKPLIELFKKLPGVGSRTAEKFSFEILSWDLQSQIQMAKILETLKEKLPFCDLCGCISENHTCPFCDNSSRDKQKLCILAHPKEVYAIEQTHSFEGLYHIIEHLISPLDGRHAQQINIEKIRARIEDNRITEIILALDSTLEGDTTALFLKSVLQKPNLSFTRFAFGIPLGSNLEYIDGATLGRAMKGRQNF